MGTSDTRLSHNPVFHAVQSEVKYAAEADIGR